MSNSYYLATFNMNYIPVNFTRNLFKYFFYLLMGIQVAAIHGAETKLEFTPPDYVQIYEKILEENVTQYGWNDHQAPFEERSFKELNARRPYFLFECSMLAMQLYAHTGNEAYPKMAQAFFEKALNWSVEIQSQLSNRSIHDTDCFLMAPMMISARKLKQAERFKLEWDEAFDLMVNDTLQSAIRWARSMSHSNRVTVPLAGAAALLKMYPDDPRMTELKVALEDYWQMITEVGDLDENSGNYSSLGFAGIVLMAQQLEVEEDFQAPQFRNAFVKYLNMISPEGYIPEWGDDYFHPSPMLRWVNLFEYAASIYQDPYFAGGARKVYAAYETRKSDYGRYFEKEMIDYPLLLDTKLHKDTGKLPTPGDSLITHRNDRMGARHQDKMILRTGQEPGDAMVMLDLYSRGDHSQATMDNRPSISYYEANSTPLFYNYARHVPGAPYGNQIFVGEDSPRWPRRAEWPEKTWRTQQVPTDRLNTIDGNTDPLMRELTGMHIRFLNEGFKGVRLYIDNLRLVGPKGILMVDDFEWPASGDQNISWNPVQIVSKSDKHTEGKSSARIQLSPNGSVNSPRIPYDFKFNIEDYPLLQYDLMYEGDFPMDALTGMEIRFPTGRGGINAWHHWSMQTLLGNIDTAQCEQRGKDAFGYVSFNNYTTDDSSLSRGIVLTEEGILIIRDILYPGEHAIGQTAGSLWQLYSYDERGDNWFTSYGEAPQKSISEDIQYGGHGMTVWFEPKVSREYGVQKIEGFRHGNFKGFQYQRNSELNISYSKQAIVSQQPISWFTIVVPQSRGIPGREIARHIQTAHDWAKIELEGVTLIVHNDGKGAWSIKREANQISYSYLDAIIANAKDAISNINGQQGWRFFDDAIDRWLSGSVNFPVYVNKPGTYRLLLNQASGDSAQKVRIETGEESFETQVIEVDSDQNYQLIEYRTVYFSTPGWKIITLSPVEKSQKNGLMKLKGLQLIQR